MNSDELQSALRCIESEADPNVRALLLATALRGGIPVDWREVDVSRRCRPMTTRQW